MAERQPASEAPAGALTSRRHAPQISIRRFDFGNFEIDVEWCVRARGRRPWPRFSADPPAACSRGERFDLEKHEQGTEVKAITYSAMQIHQDQPTSDIYVILDI